MADIWDSLAEPLALSLRLGVLTGGILVVVATPLAWWICGRKGVLRAALETLLSLSIVLPPSVLGFYLLMAFGGSGWLGQFWQSTFGAPLAFSFTGLLLGSLIYALPYVIQPIVAGFDMIGKRPLELAASLGMSPLVVFFQVALPLARHSVVMGGVLGFAHTLGEFGVVLMIGGSIPGETQVMSIAIYDHVEAMEYDKAHLLSGVLLGLSFILLVILSWLKTRMIRKPLHA